MSRQQFNEGLERGDLMRLIHPELHIDEFRSKLGRDEDVAVVSFKIANKEPGQDLVSFCEKGYEWVIDADISSGEMDDGEYLVFVEIDRDQSLPKHIMDLMKDLMNLTNQNLSDWRLRYQSNQEDHEVSEESIKALCPTSSEDYKRKFGKEEIDKLKTAAGVKVDTKAPKNDFTESLRVAAGIR
jgi:hypothetical protein